MFKYVLALVFAVTLPGLVSASSIMAVGQDEGYSSKVMDKIIGKWSPPPQLKREYKLKLRIALDGHGRLLECKAQRSSGLDALDASACAAVRQAAPFGDPPYGMPADIYLSFWTGNPQGHIPPEADIRDHAFTGESAAAEARATAMNASAKAKAEQAAKASGKPLPGTAPATADKPKNKAESPEKPSQPKSKEPETQPKAAEIPKIPESKPVEAPKASEPAPAPEFAHNKYREEYAPYINQVLHKIRNSMYIPQQTKIGTYYATAQVNFTPQGKITSCSIIKGSGDNLLDKYVLQGIKRAKQIPPPPQGLGDTLDLTFTLVRMPDKKPARQVKTEPPIPAQ